MIIPPGTVLSHRCDKKYTCKLLCEINVCNYEYIVSAIIRDTVGAMLSGVPVEVCDRPAPGYPEDPHCTSR